MKNNVKKNIRKRIKFDSFHFHRPPLARAFCHFNAYCPQWLVLLDRLSRLQIHEGTAGTNFGRRSFGTAAGPSKTDGLNSKEEARMDGRNWRNQTNLFFNLVKTIKNQIESHSLIKLILIN
jgi:hypothetical protein